MKEMDELEPQQYQRQYWEDDVPLRDVRKSTLRRFVYIGAGLFLVFIFIGSIIKFPDEVQLPFVLKTDKAEDIYRFPYPLYVVDKYVAPGNKVPKGTPLMRITSPEIVILINNYNEAKQNFENYHGQQTMSVQKQKDIINTRIGQARSKVMELKRELAVLDSIWKSNRARLEFEKEDAEKRLEKNRNLYSGKYISNVELKDVESRSVRAYDDIITARQQYERDKGAMTAMRNEYELEIVSLGQQLGKTSIDSKYDSVKYYNQLVLATDQVKNTFGDFEIADGAIVVKANADGIVSFVFEGEKEVLQGAVLAKVQYGKVPVYSLAISPPSLVGKLAVNQQAFLKVATFPSYEWGTVAAHIQHISLTPDEKGNFNVRIDTDDLRKMKGMLQSGMNGTATIVLHERTFFEYFFRDLKKTWYKATNND